MIEPMTRADFDTVLDWAAAEGWNPGREDAEAFRAADPDGFLTLKLDGVPVSAISVVNHSDRFAFLGLYLCHPAHRGQGHGLAIWQAGLAHAGTRTVGLDGVPDQQANYARSGFVRVGGATRFTGVGPTPSSMSARAVSPADVPALLASELASSGIDSRRFLEVWFRDTVTRRTLVMPDGGGIAAYGTVRACRTGAKIGPFSATDSASARALLGALAGMFAVPVSLDVPETAIGLRALLERCGFAQSFSTARMYLGAPPVPEARAFRSVATLELG